MRRWAGQLITATPASRIKKQHVGRTSATICTTIILMMTSNSAIDAMSFTASHFHTCFTSRVTAVLRERTALALRAEIAWHGLKGLISNARI